MTTTFGSVTVTSSFCERMKQKLHQLAKMGKLSLSRGCLKGKNKEENVLDLGKGYFSAGCRKASCM